MLQQKFLALIAEKLDAKEPQKVLVGLELNAANQAIRILEGAVGASPVMGLSNMEQAIAQAFTRLSYVTDPALRKLCELALVEVFQNFFEDFQALFDIKQQLILDEIAKASEDAVLNERAMAAATEAGKKALQEALSIPVEDREREAHDPFAQLREVQRRHEKNREPTDEELNAIRKEEQEAALKRAQEKLRKAKEERNEQ